MKKATFTLMLILSVVLSKVSYAQSYTVSASAGNMYKELTAPVMLSAKDSIAGYYMLNIPFKLKCYGINTSFGYGNGVIFSQGYVGDGVSSCFASPYYAALTRRDAQSSISYQVDGRPGTRILMFQWKNMGLEGAPAANFVNVQVWFHEVDNTVSVHIGPSKVDEGANCFFGHSGPQVGLYHLNSTYTAYINNTELGGDAASPTVNTQDVFLSSVPAEGMIYTFSPAASGISEAVGTSASLSAYPNPFSTSATISYTTHTSGSVSLAVYDLAGHMVSQLMNADQPAGSHAEVISRGQLPAGLYICRLTTPEGSASLKLAVSE